MDPREVVVGTYCICKYIDPIDREVGLHRARVERIDYQQKSFRGSRVSI